MPNSNLFGRLLDKAFAHTAASMERRGYKLKKGMASKKVKDTVFATFEKDGKNNLTFHSRHDSKEEAESERDSLNTRMSKADTLKFLKDLTHSMNL